MQNSLLSLFIIDRVYLCCWSSALVDNSSSFMDVQGPRNQEQQWHPAIGLASFLGHVSNLQNVVDMCNTAEFRSIDKAKIKVIMQWGLWIEEVRREEGTVGR